MLPKFYFISLTVVAVYGLLMEQRQFYSPVSLFLYVLFSVFVYIQRHFFAVQTSYVIYFLNSHLSVYAFRTIAINGTFKCGHSYFSKLIELKEI